MLTLGIESSCDDTSLAIIEDGVRVRASLVSSQIDVHRRFGGVVPEVASRKHLEAIHPLLQQVLQQADLSLDEIGQIAVTTGPGLLGALLVGVSVGKALAWLEKKPLIPVNHLEAHLYAAFLAQNRAPEYPFLGLIVSGGHSTLALVEGARRIRTLGRTVDDAPGEFFDKIARHLQLGYPGGPVVQKAGEGGDPSRYPLPRPMVGRGYDFSFSGLKTAVLQRAKLEGDALVVRDLCAAMQQAVAGSLTEKVARALEETRVPRLVVAGGVAANAVLRERMAALATQQRVELLIPGLNLCTDNAAMIGAAGYWTAEWWQTDTLLVNAQADWELGAPLSD
ncbi:MAG TPA: tRNA (adenosine(37)-N6)-threonylcarbamoyltransferase complex transferase subunit TsaD [Candidatus Ozemobacteraceae bacterium]|nr:tRNA (adenosine(37)-N6)-threonylcarbamoyltransferase complex transferase subunit TsaD [Candidatus Ozemobacteraceae bacterium]